MINDQTFIQGMNEYLENLRNLILINKQKLEAESASELAAQPVIATDTIEETPLESTPIEPMDPAPVPTPYPENPVFPTEPNLESTPVPTEPISYQESAPVSETAPLPTEPTVVDTSLESLDQVGALEPTSPEAPSMDADVPAVEFPTPVFSEEETANDEKYVAVNNNVGPFNPSDYTQATGDVPMPPVVMPDGQTPNDIMPESPVISEASFPRAM